MPASDNKFRLSVDLDAEKATVVVHVIERETKKEVEVETFNATEVHTNLRTNVALYGLSKLLQDRTSETEVGPGKLAAMRELFAQLSAGVWEKERKVGTPVVSAEVEALAEMRSWSVAEAQTALRKYSKEQRSAILSHESVVAKAAEIRGRRQSAEALSLDALLPAA